jgi:hypothetical protein
MRTETEYMLMVDFADPVIGFGSTPIYQPHGTTEASALAMANGFLERGGVTRVEIFAREVPVEWTKVEEIEPRTEAPVGKRGGADAGKRALQPLECGEQHYFAEGATVCTCGMWSNHVKEPR